MLEKVTIVKRHKRYFDVPAFPGYVFVSGDASERYAAMATRYTIKLIDCKDQRRLVRDLSHLQQALRLDRRVDPVHGIVEGCRVRIGPGHSMEGVEGIFIHRGKWQLVLQVELLGQSVALDIDPEFVEALN